jgi:uncharacterized RDD family membrane protein YckC
MSDIPQLPDLPPQGPGWSPLPSEPVWTSSQVTPDPPEDDPGFQPRYAGFLIRGAAFVIDFVIFSLLWVTLIGIPVAIAYMPVMWWKNGATIGQRALKLRVVRASDGGPVSGRAATIRFVVMALECILGVFGVFGFIWAIFDSEKQAWHDKPARTLVIHVD